MQASLIVVAKKPEPGLTKTRLCPPLSPPEAAELYRCMMLDTLALAARLKDVAHCLAFTPARAQAYFQTLVPEGFTLIAQQGADLGERLANALAYHFEHGCRRAVILNSDGPTLPQSYLQQAFVELEYNDVTLGMGHDGGYYLIGMKSLHSELFRGISWSTDRVISQTLAACQRRQLKVHRLPQWYDVDVAEDLRRLRRDLAHNPSAAPATNEFLQHRMQERLPIRSPRSNRPF